VTLLSVTGLRTEILTRTGPRTVLEGLSFTVEPGEVLAIIGESGSGKSVAMQSITGLLPSPPCRVTSGSAIFEGRDLLQLPEAELRQLRGNRIGMIFQEPMSALNPMMAVGDQIAETIVTHRGTSWTAARAEAVRLLDRVRIPDAAGRARLHPGALSGGMRQRVVIAAALSCKPALVIADEPTTALDATVQGEILDLLGELRAEMGCAVLFITHDMGVVRRIADRVLVLRHGVEVETGSRDQLFTSPRTDYTRLLIAASAPAEPRRNSQFGTTGLPHGVPPLAIDNLIVSYPRSTSMTSFAPAERIFAVDDVSLTLEAGETLALVGESGSGKTTIARAILGLTPIEEGRIRVAGADIAGSPAATRGRVQFIFQDPQSSLDPRYPAWRSIIEPLRLSGEASTTMLRATATTLLEQVGLGADYLDRFPHELSGGQRQRLGIARALSVAPDLVIADEAVSALDATTRLQVLDLMATIQRDTGLPFLFITHDFAVVKRAAHRVAVMRFGRLVELGPTASVLESPQHPYTRALVAASQGLKSALPDSHGHRIGKLGSQQQYPPMREVSGGHFVAQL